MARTPNWDIDKIEEGLLYDTKNPSAQYDHYNNITKRLVLTELPATLRLHIKPNTPEACDRARQNLTQWFLRWYGPYYLNTDVHLDERGLWLVVWRGKDWYHPNSRMKKMQEYAARIGATLTRNGAVLYKNKTRSTDVME